MSETTEQQIASAKDKAAQKIGYTSFDLIIAAGHKTTLEECYELAMQIYAKSQVEAKRERLLEAPLDFGRYCTIEQNRFGSDNEHYIHKVIGRLRSNTWVDVPVVRNPVETIHDHMEDVIACVCCGLAEREIFRYRLSDCKPQLTELLTPTEPIKTEIK